MKLAIFGAAGRTGIPLVQQALEGGNDVVALVRAPSKLSIRNERLTAVQGDVANLADVERAVQGADVKNSEQKSETPKMRAGLALESSFTPVPPT
jgi:putative NADH-flavin reductase